jgi:glyceraldehyde 3-phosphate dehydrogenase
VAAPLKLVQEKWGIEFASVSSIHSVTHSQNLLDNSGRDLRRSRSALMSIIPTTTGATDVVGKIIPELDGKLNGIAYRVPIVNSSIGEIMIHLSKKTTLSEVKEFFRGIAKDPYYAPILAVNEDPLVSIDFKGNPHSCIIDLGLTQLDGGRYLKLFAWYDNEWGYANRVVDMIEQVGKTL